MNEEFINVYIEMNSKKIEELVRSELILQTRLVIAEKAVARLMEENSKLQEELDLIKSEIKKENILSAFENKKPVKKDKDSETSVF